MHYPLPTLTSRAALIRKESTSPPEQIINWPDTRFVPDLGIDDIHLWCAWLDDPGNDPTWMTEILSEDERARADRLRYTGDRRHFVVARAILRNLLSRYLNLDPEHLRFAYGPAGKPYLAHPIAMEPLSFNLAHSGAIALYAISRHERIGVDVELVRPVGELLPIADLFFTPEDAALLGSLGELRRRDRFFQLWTRREAVGKAVGIGLTESTLSMEVSRSREPAPPERDSNSSWNHWTLIDLKPAPEYVGALAIERPSRSLHCWRWYV